jgi:lysophospholipase L1-like esterase
MSLEGGSHESIFATVCILNVSTCGWCHVNSYQDYGEQIEYDWLTRQYLREFPRIMMLRKYIISLMCLFSATGFQGHAEEVKIAIAGSSAAESYGNSDGRLIFGWGELMQDFFIDAEIVNFARGGYSTKKFFDRGNWHELIASKPDFILMNLGANDSKPDEERYTDPDGQYKRNLHKFATDADEIGAEIIFITLNERLQFHENGKVFAEDRVPYTQAMKEVAAELNLTCVDLSAKHSELLESLGEEGARYLFRLRTDGTLDISHYSRPGAIRLAEMIAAGLKNSDSKIKQYLR